MNNTFKDRHVSYQTLDVINKYQLANADTQSNNNLLPIRQTPISTDLLLEPLNCRSSHPLNENNSHPSVNINAWNGMDEETLSLDLDPAPSFDKITPCYSSKHNNNQPDGEINTPHTLPDCFDDDLQSTLQSAPNLNIVSPLNPNMSISINDAPNNNDTVIDPQNKSFRANSAQIDIGSVVASKYEILSQISEGGYGVVYRARQLGVDRVVALKRLRSQKDPSVMKRFLLEANIIKDLIHPNTIQLIDAGVDNEHLFIVMEYIDGLSLKSLISKEKSLPIERAIHIAIQILKSLHEAHERGITHRDIKSSNVLIRNIIGEKDFIKVLDFGIAKAKYINTQRLTQDGKIMGTPQYLAPELLFGDAPTPAVDIFAVGIILVEMLTGSSPLPKDTHALLKLATSDQPIPIPEWLLKSPIAHIIQCALQKDPKKRYHSAAEMITDLQSLEYQLIAPFSLKTQVVPTNHFQNNKKILTIAIATAILIIAANFYFLFHL